MRGVVATFALVTAALMLAEVAIELVQGRLLEIDAGRIGWPTAVLLVVWLVAIVFTAWPAVVDEWRERR